MADLKIDIIANASNALKGIDAVIDSTNKLRTAVAKSGNRDVGGVVSNDTLKAAKAYEARLQRIVSLSGDYTKDISAAQKVLKTLTSEYQKLATISNTTAVNEFFSKGIKDVQEYIDELQKASEEQKKLIAQSNAKNNFDETWGKAKAEQKSYGDDKTFMRLTGDEVGLARLQLEEYAIALKRAIALEGEGSVQTKKLADQYNKQKAALDSLSKTTTKFSVRVSNLIKSFVSAQAIVYLVQKTFQLFTDGVKAASNAAAEAEETANLFNTTFSNVAVTANNVATSMSSAMGISTAAAQQALGTFGDLAMGYGQTQSAALEFAESAVRTGLDLISFKNITGDTTEILQAMASGLAGNFENFRKWGIIVTMTEVNSRLAAKGYDKLTGSALQFAKVQETLAIVQEKSANAQGDMVKTLDSTANVTRRVSEANKELLANIGTGINEVLTPLKLMWLDIAESINKAVKAQALYDAGQKNIGVYDIRNNKQDRKDFEVDVINSYGTASYFGKMKIIDEEAFLDSMNEVMRIYEATASDVLMMLRRNGVEYSESIASAIIEIEKLAKAERSEEKELEGRRSTLEDLTASAENYFAALQAIQGVSINTGFEKYHHEGNIKNIISSSEALDGAEEEIAERVRNGVLEGFDSLKSANWENYLSPIDIVLGKTGEMDGLTKKLDAVSSYYEEVSNYAITSGQDFTDILSAVAMYYKEIQESIEAITSEEERRAQLKGIASGFESQAADINTQKNQLGMSEREKALDNIARQYEESLSYLDKSSATYGMELDSLTSSMQALRDATNGYYDVLEAKEAEEEKRNVFTNALDELKSVRDDARSQLITSGMTDRETALYELLGLFKTVIAALDPNSSTYAQDHAIASAYFQDAVNDINEYYDNKARQAEKDAADAYVGVIDASGRQTTFTLPWQSSLDSAIDAFETSFNDWAALYIEAGHTQAEVDAEYSKQLENLKKNQIEDSYAASGVTLMNGLGESLDLFNAISAAGSGMGFGSLLSIFANLAVQTEAFAKASSILTDNVLPIIDAFLEPLIPVIEQLGEILQRIVYPVLNALFPPIEDVASWLSMLLETLTPVLDIFEVLMNMLRGVLIPILTLITGVLSPIMDLLTGVFQVIASIVIPVLNALTPIVKLLAAAFVTVYGVLSVVVNFIVDAFKWVAGNVVVFFTDMYNNVAKVLKGINIFGWRPFGNMQEYDNGWAKDWAATDVFGNINKNWDSAMSLLDEIERNTLEIADNTSDVDLSVYEDLRDKGIISANEYMAMVNEALGKGAWDPVETIKTENGSYVDYRNTGSSLSVSYGDTTIIVQGEGLDSEEIANAIYRKLQDRDRAGAAVFATY